MFSSITKGQVAVAWLLLVCRAACGQYAFTDVHLFSIPGSTGSRWTNYDGLYPQSPVVLSDGMIFGTASAGGTNGFGTVFRVHTDGTGFATLRAFIDNINGYDGDYPFAGLTIYNGSLYGTTGGGNLKNGTIFRINTDGTGFTNLHYFSGDDGDHPDGRLTIVGNALFGTTRRTDAGATGTVFKIDTDGNGFVTLHSFSGSDGDTPFGLTRSADSFYGITVLGGLSGYGTIFKIGTNGLSFTNIWSFTGGQDGEYPEADLILSGQTLYGTTYGANLGYGTIFKINVDGTGFATLRTFNYNDGAYPLNFGGLTLRGNTLYGTTFEGGAFGNGTVFQINTDGSGFASLYSFSGAEGYNPQAGLIISGDTLYGAASESDDSVGAVFALTLPPLLPTISAVQTDDRLSVFWPTNVTGFQLQSKTDLNSSNWINCAPVSIVGTNYGFCSIISGNRFFRLAK